MPFFLVLESPEATTFLLIKPIDPSLWAHKAFDNDLSVWINDVNALFFTNYSINKAEAQKKNFQVKSYEKLDRRLLTAALLIVCKI